MKTSDDGTKSGGNFVHAGVGLMMTFLCAGPCGRSTLSIGSKSRQVRGLKQKVCADCAAVLDAKRAARLLAKEGA